MKMLLTALFAAIALAGSALVAGDAPRTLAPSFYDTAKPGKALALVLVDPAYDKSKGFTFDGKITAVSFSGNEFPLQYNLAPRLTDLARPSSPFSLKVTIVRCTLPVGHFLHISKGEMVVEGRILDSAGRSVCSFVAKEKVGTSDDDSFEADIQKIVAAIQQDLL